MDGGRQLREVEEERGHMDAAGEEEPPPPKIEEPPVAPPKDLTALTPEPVAKEKAEEQTIKTQKELEEIKTPVGNND